MRLVEHATAMASTDGLEGVTVGRLADAAGVSKSGVTRHFPSKLQLQLETLAHALERFTELVWVPASARRGGLERLLALCDAWTNYLAGDAFPGGCFLTAASVEFDGREGPVRDALRAALERWLSVLAREVEQAVADGDLVPDVDPRALAFELNALAVGTNQAVQLLGDAEAPTRGRALMHRAILSRADRSGGRGRRRARAISRARNVPGQES